MSTLTNTGERAMPGILDRTALEHLHRYAIASPLCQGRDIADVASGEGYGTHFLAQTAKSVVGVDVSSDAVTHATAKYVRANLKFCEGSIEALPLPDSSVDVFTCFETIEHVSNPEKALKEIKRVLRPDGICLISTPCRAAYNAASAEKNPFHTREFEAQEFEQFLKGQFRNVAMSFQRMSYSSLLYQKEEDIHLQALSGSFDELGGFAPKTPMYVLALATDGEATYLPNSVFEANDDALLSQVFELELGESVKLRHELEAIRQSTSFRLGQAIIGPLFKLKKLLRR